MNKLTRGKMIGLMILLGLTIGGIFNLGIWMGRSTSSAGPTVPAEDASKPTIWTCSMHPQIRQSEPGDCPICGMDLIPASDSSDESLGPRMMSMSEEAKRLAEVQTSPVERRFVDVEIPLVGKVDFDETRVKTISAWVPGRLDRLFVDYTGIQVKKGDHLVEMYSPQLLTAQDNLLQAKRALLTLEEQPSVVRQSTEMSIAASREKLSLLGLTDEQIKQLEERGTANATVEIKAPSSGIVVHMNAKQGAYVQTGTPIYTVADLSMVWVMLDAYESDIAWLRYGQEVEIKTEAYGDRSFSGWISFIDPVLDPKTRTIKVRVVVENPDGKLRPNMFVRASVNARITSDAEVVTRNLVDKWISPMHPEIIKDGPGTCDICGMPLVKASELGYAKMSESSVPLVVPASAVLTTGERALVYVAVPDKERPTYQLVEIQIGPRAGDVYLVLGGLEEGQQVVTEGNFKIDSALQLLAKPSMMNPESAAKPEPAESIQSQDAPVAFVRQLSPLYQHYLAAQTALAGDDEAKARAALDALSSAVKAVDMKLVNGDAHVAWMKIQGDITTSLEHRAHREGIEGVRGVFKPLSAAMIRLDKTFGHEGDPHHVAFCPMADNDAGAHWLQLEKEISNPYFGDMMLRCGEIKETLPTNPETSKEAAHEHQH